MSVIKATVGLPGAALRRAPWDFLAVALGSGCLSGLSYAYYHSAGFILLSNDAVSRLNIARRVFDSLDPGIVQLGGIWPPLPVILMLPLVWIDPLWRSGLAGSIPSMAAFVAASVYIYALGFRLTGSRLGGLAASLVLVTNPSLLYLQAVPLSEPLMLLTISGAAYHLLSWLDDERMAHLMAAAAWVFLGSLTRYDGWALLPAGTLIVLAFTLIRYRDRRRAEALTLAFWMPAAYGAFLWLFFLVIIFPDPFAFLPGEGSPGASGGFGATYSQLAGKWEHWTRFVTIGWSYVDIVGLPTLLIAALGVGFAFLGRARSRGNAIVLFVFAPALANIFILLFSEAPVLFSPHTPTLGEAGTTRYGLLALPAIALLAAYPARLGRMVGSLTVISLLVVFAVVYWPTNGLVGGAPSTPQAGEYWPSGRDEKEWIQANLPLLRGYQPITLMDSLRLQAGSQTAIEAAAWLRTRNSGERVLISAFANDPFMFYSGLPQKTFVFEGAQPYWDDELEEPGTWTEWIVVTQHRKDLVNLRLGKRIESSRRFELAFENNSYKIYKVVSPVNRAEEVKR